MTLPPGVDVFFAVSWGRFDLVVTWQGAVPLAILFSGLLGAMVAIVAIWSARQIDRRKNAADFILQGDKDIRLKRAVKFIRDIDRDPNVSIEKYAHKENAEKYVKETEKIRYILNHYETVAINIKRKIYDENVIKSSDYTIVVRLWRNVWPYIEKVRDEYEYKAAYTEFQWLFRRWKRYWLVRLCEWLFLLFLLFFAAFVLYFFCVFLINVPWQHL